MDIHVSFESITASPPYSDEVANGSSNPGRDVEVRKVATHGLENDLGHRGQLIDFCSVSRIQKYG